MRGIITLFTWAAVLLDEKNREEKSLYDDIGL
jgi:hypothetical protein